MDKRQDLLNDITSEVTSEHPVVSNEDWIAARKELLKKEKALTRLNDEISAERRKLPWVKVDKSYVFESTEGQVTLSDLFGKNSQLYIYHFMFAPDWEEGCPGCSFMADHIDGPNLHLAHHDISMVVVSRTPLAKLLAFQKRMGWKFKWVSSYGSDFNYDYHVSFTEDQIKNGGVYYNYAYSTHDTDTESPGSSVFYKDGAGQIYHTYSSYSRGGDILIGAHNFLDLMPKGRDEHGTMDWMRLHDQYDNVKNDSDSCCH